MQQRDHPQHVLSALTSVIHREGAKMNFAYDLIWSERPLHCKPFNHIREGEYQDLLYSLLPEVLVRTMSVEPCCLFGSLKFIF